MRHRHLIFFAALAVVALGMAAAPAWAQAALPARPVRIDIGLLLPTDGTVRSRTGSAHFAVGGTLDVRKAGPGTLGLYADGSLLNESRKAMNMASVGVSYRAYLSPVASDGGYAGVGAGAYYLDYKDSRADGNKVGAGGKLFAGYDFPAGAFAEADYTLAPKVVGRSQDSVQLLLGYRF